MTQQRCSFCRVPTNQVEKIIFGTHFNICSDCIRTCLVVLDGEGDTGWIISTSPQRCGNCDRRPSEGYRHVMNRATYSPRICERCIRIFTETLLKELPTIEEELQSIFRNVFESDPADIQEDPDDDESSDNTGPNHSDHPTPETEQDHFDQMRSAIDTKTRAQIDDLAQQTLADFETRVTTQQTTQPEPSTKRLKNELKKPLAILFDFGDTLLTHIAFNPEAGTAAVLKIANNPKGYMVADIHDRLEKINRDLLPRREQSQIEFHPHLVQRHVYEGFNITFDRDPAAVERVFWRAAMQWKPEPNVEKMLQTLQTYHIPMGIVSNTSFTGTTLWWEIEHQGLADYFRFLMSSADYWVRKPHPLIMETAAAKLSLDPTHVWYVGNSPQYDIAAAQSVGMGAVWYNRQDAPCDGPDPHVEVKTWNEFIELVKQYVNP